jgi:hypothetical protein
MAVWPFPLTCLLGLLTKLREEVRQKARVLKPARLKPEKSTAGDACIEVCLVKGVGTLQWCYAVLSCVGFCMHHLKSASLPAHMFLKCCALLSNREVAERIMQLRVHIRNEVVEELGNIQQDNADVKRK